MSTNQSSSTGISANVVLIMSGMSLIVSTGTAILAGWAYYKYIRPAQAIFDAQSSQLSADGLNEILTGFDGL